VGTPSGAARWCRRDGCGSRYWRPYSCWSMIWIPSNATGIKPRCPCLQLIQRLGLKREMIETGVHRVEPPTLHELDGGIGSGEAKSVRQTHLAEFGGAGGDGGTGYRGRSRRWRQGRGAARRRCCEGRGVAVSQHTSTHSTNSAARCASITIVACGPRLVMTGKMDPSITHRFSMPRTRHR
jgi:hypothetical protein